MPDPNPEPDKYSIDDMMDRLRSRGEGPRDGEPQLITREDGTQVYRMRKRKRRSHQPKKEREKRQQRFRIFQVVAMVGVILLAGLALLGAVVYLNSSAYRAIVLERIRVWTGAEPVLTQFRVSPVGVAARSIELNWPASSRLESLKLDAVGADIRISSIFGGAWKGSEMSAAGGRLVLRQPLPGAAPAPAAPRSGECPFQFRYRVPKLTVYLGGAERPPARIHDTEASLVVQDAATGTANLQLEGGLLSVDRLGEFRLAFASLQFEGNGVRVGTIRLAAGSAGKGEVEILNPRQTALDLDGGDTRLTARVQDLPLAGLLGPAFGTWLSAEVESPEGADDGALVFRSGPDAAISYRLPFIATASSESRAKGLPLLGVLARELNEPWYETPRFDAEAKGVLVREGGASGVGELRLESRGRLLVTGGAMVDAAGVLSGELQIGLPEAAMEVTSPAFRAVFKRREGGFSWATIRLSGSGQRPVDDLEDQLKAAEINTAPAAGGTKSIEDAFRELTTPEAR